MIYNLIAAGILATGIVVGTAIIFGLYYLLYAITIKHKKKITNESLVAILPLIVGIINTIFILGGFLLSVLFLNSLESFGAMVSGMFFLFFVWIPIYPLLIFFIPCFSVPFSIASIAITIVEMKKNYITKKRFLMVLVLNGIYTISVAIFLISWFSNSLPT